MAQKFIPDGDSDFLGIARSFATQLIARPEVYGTSLDEAQKIAQAVEAFGVALQANQRGYTRSRATAAQKDEARAEAERLIRKAAHLIRINDQISAADKIQVRVKDRPTRLHKRACPQTAPDIMLAAGKSAQYATPGVHQIIFLDRFGKGTKAKPEGAVRMELFVDLIAPRDPIPAYPGQARGGAMWYLRSYTRSPARVEYPKSEVPMRVVYWGRWANATGETGPFSKTLSAPIEGRDWSRLALPAPQDDVGAANRLEQKVIITSARRELPGCVETIDTLRAESSRMLPDKAEEPIRDAA